MSRKVRNIVGERFNRLTVLERAGNNKSGKVCFRCRCDCGCEIIVTGNHLLSGNTKSCGCLKHEPTNRAPMEGKTFGRLTALSYDHTEGKSAFYRCRCECGREIIVRGLSLRRGDTRSCGCLRREVTAQKNTDNQTHGMYNSKIYKTWVGIKTRCYNSNDNGYKNYGGRGITMYEPWINDFQAFYDYVSQLEHFGEEGFSLDRINNDGNYEPGNLRWTTMKEQSRNRRTNVWVEYNGEQITLVEAAERSGIRYDVLHYRYKHGWAIEDLFRPISSK